MSGSTLESELKFRADDAAPLDRLAAASSLGRATLGPATTIDERDRYLDTADLRLATAGWACRLRSRGDGVKVSLKGPARHLPGAALHERPEIEGPATQHLDPGRWSASRARKRLLELTGGRPLIERFRLDQRRTERSVTLSGRSAGLLSLDRVSVRDGDRLVGHLFVVELEFRPSPDLAVVAAELGADLAAQEGLRPDAETKLVHALDLLSAAQAR